MCETEINEKGYPHYKLLDNKTETNHNNRKVDKLLVAVDNGMLVSYNPYI